MQDMKDVGMMIARYRNIGGGLLLGKAMHSRRIYFAARSAAQNF